MAHIKDAKSQSTVIDTEQAGFAEQGEIAERAYQLWIRRGCPDGSAEEDWLEAERELHDATLSRRLLTVAEKKSGSVQA